MKTFQERIQEKIAEAEQLKRLQAQEEATERAASATKERSAEAYANYVATLVDYQLRSGTLPTSKLLKEAVQVSPDSRGKTYGKAWAAAKLIRRILEHPVIGYQADMTKVSVAGQTYTSQKEMEQALASMVGARIPEGFTSRLLFAVKANLSEASIIASMLEPAPRLQSTDLTLEDSFKLAALLGLDPLDHTANHVPVSPEPA